MVGYSDDRADSGSMVGLSRPGLGRLLGLGPGGECCPPALVNSDRFPALDVGAGAAWHAQDVEFGPGDRLVCSFDLWHIRGAQRYHQFRALVCLFGDWWLFSGVPGPYFFLQYPPLHPSFTHPPAPAGL